MHQPRIDLMRRRYGRYQLREWPSREGIVRDDRGRRRGLRNWNDNRAGGFWVSDFVRVNALDNRRRERHLSTFAQHQRRHIRDDLVRPDGHRPTVLEHDYLG